MIDEFNILLQKKREDSTEEDLEYAIFEYVADEVLKSTDSAQLGEIEKFIREQPEFSRKLREAGFGPKGLRLVISGVFKAASKGGFGTYITAVKAAAFLNRKLGTRLAMNVVTKGLKTVLKSLDAALWVWLVYDVLSWFFGPSRRRLLPVIAQIHQHYLLEKIEE